MNMQGFRANPSTKQGLAPVIFKLPLLLRTNPLMGSPLNLLSRQSLESLLGAEPTVKQKFIRHF